MRCFTFVHGQILEGIQVSTQGGQHVFLGQLNSSSGEKCKACRLEVSKDEPPEVKDNILLNAFPGISQRIERSVLVHTDHQSSSVLLRINTSCAEPTKHVKGKWFQVFGKLNVVDFGKGPSYIDSVLVLKSGCSVIITEEGGNKFLVTNYKGSMVCSSVIQQVWFEDRRNNKKNSNNRSRNPEAVDESREINEEAVLADSE